jgi:hypothetical protein
VISKRMVKKQQMRWSPRTRVLDGDLATDFARWYPDEEVDGGLTLDSARRLRLLVRRARCGHQPRADALGGHRLKRKVQA